jgi:hypothetical protein
MLYIICLESVYEVLFSQSEGYDDRAKIRDYTKQNWHSQNMQAFFSNYLLNYNNGNSSNTDYLCQISQV